MNDIAIRVQNLGKQYRIAHLQPKYDTLRDALASSARGLVQSIASRLRGKQDHRKTNELIWALHEVSFEVKPGEVVGIIGNNGAGKSTLLKILSRITEPTTGWAEIHGRVGSLLEVGTGFHAELTGRENIYLNGAILGMRRTEIEQKFDEIVAFAEVEKFIDTPVKHYSSGMYLRLAFAVAAHLEPEILFVDEVLAVGDASFQKKCLGKMGDVAREGRTVLLVSHNMDAIRRLCNRCVLLEDGQVTALGDSASVIPHYLICKRNMSEPNVWIDVSRAQRTGTGEARFMAVQYSSHSNKVADYPYSNGPLDFQIMIVSDSQRSIKRLAVIIWDTYRTKLINIDIVSRGEIAILRKGENITRFLIKKLHLNPGIYVLGLWASDSTGHTLFDFIESAFQIEVVQVDSIGLGVTPISNGLVTCCFEFSQIT